MNKAAALQAGLTSIKTAAVTASDRQAKNAKTIKAKDEQEVERREVRRVTGYVPTETDLAIKKANDHVASVTQSKSTLAELAIKFVQAPTELDRVAVQNVMASEVANLENLQAEYRSGR